MEQYESSDMIKNTIENNLIVMTLSGTGAKLDDNYGFAISQSNNDFMPASTSQSFSARAMTGNEYIVNLSINSNMLVGENDLMMGEIQNGIVFNFPGTAQSDTTVNFSTYISQFAEAGTPIYINQFGPDDQILFTVDGQYGDESKYNTSFDSETGMLTVNYLNEDGTTTNIATFNYINPVDPDIIPKVSIAPDGNGEFTVTLQKCFLTGTNILTPDGEIAIENLNVGDIITTLHEGKRIPKPIIWVGSKEINIHYYHNKESLYPIRIKAHAFDINQPCRDLLITQEHTIYINNKLTPARMLVNGCSIIIDRSMKDFTVHHIETKDHSILLSENLTTESYLNTDNHHIFNNTKIAHLNLSFDEHSGHKNWKDHAAAPLAVNRDHVEPIWQALNNRAIKQGYTPVPKQKTTRDPSLCLITKNGKHLIPIDISENIYSFYVPQNVHIVAINSKAALPSEAIGPFVDDRRQLGVLVSKISIVGNNSLTIIPADMENLFGWHPVEKGRNDRWTKGMAMLPTEIKTTHQAGYILRIELTATTDYFVENIYLNAQTA